MDIKDIILNYRTENKISQREFARRCGLSNSLISILEMGENPQTGKKMSPDLITYKKLATGMGITTHQLMEMLDPESHVLLFNSTMEEALSSSPRTPEARILANGIDKMPQAQREAIINMMQGLYPGLFEKGNEEDDA